MNVNRFEQAKHLLCILLLFLSIFYWSVCLFTKAANGLQLTACCGLEH